MFTARYELSLLIKFGILLVFKGVNVLQTICIQKTKEPTYLFILIAFPDSSRGINELPYFGKQFIHFPFAPY